MIELRAVATTYADDLGWRFRITTRVRGGDGLRVRLVVPEGAPPPAAGEVEPNLEEAYLALTDRPYRDRGRSAEHGYASLLDLP